jgi:hypothetical protein
LSKIFEKVTLSRLIQHFNEYCILSKEQFAFRQNSSIDKAIFQLLNQILNTFNNKTVVGEIFYDLRRACDFVDHSTLLRKLKFYGITEKMLELIDLFT